jgi:Mg-chelatase subunit ChlD
MLEHATRSPPGHWLYSVGGEPVMVMWGHSDVPPAPPLSATPAVSPGAASSLRDAAPVGTRPPDLAGANRSVAPAGAEMVSSAAGQRRKRLVPFLLLALVLGALVAGALYFLHGRSAHEAPAEPQVAEKEKPLPEEPIAQAPPEEVPKQPDPPEVVPEVPEKPKPPEKPKVVQADPLDALKQRIGAAKKDCAALKQFATNEPLLRGSDPRAAALRDEVMSALAKQCKETLIAEAKNLCPGMRPQELAPELVIVFDASGSMKYSLLATEREIQEAALTEAMISAFRAFGAQLPPGSPTEKVFREPQRITAAKQATLAIAKRIPSDTSVGLVLIEDCPFARRVGFFPPGQHGALVAQIQAIQPKGGTPLADGVAKAGQMVDGVNREALILVVSDGQESCQREDPCAVANALARAKPHLKINVVDITGTGAGNCLARATNGKVYPANSADQIALVTRQAAADALTPAHCKP